MVFFEGLAVGLKTLETSDDDAASVQTCLAFQTDRHGMLLVVRPERKCISLSLYKHMQLFIAY